MPTNAFFGYGRVLAITLLVAPGCNHPKQNIPTTAPAPVQPTPANTESPPVKSDSATSFDHPKTGTHIDFPAGWTPVASKDYTLLLKPAKSATSTEPPNLTLDIPDLPAHIPGMIPLGMTVDGYIDDLKKQFGQVEVKKEAGPTIAKAKDERVTASWTSGNTKFTEVALIVIRGDHVYLVRARFASDTSQQILPDFEKFAASLAWH